MVTRCVYSFIFFWKATLPLTETIFGGNPEKTCERTFFLSIAFKIMGEARPPQAGLVKRIFEAKKDENVNVFQEAVISQNKLRKQLTPLKTDASKWDESPPLSPTASFSPQTSASICETVARGHWRTGLLPMHIYF
jgi:hypothetical protein